jgi:hypothetical protein
MCISNYYKIKSFIFLSTGVKSCSIDWLVLIDNFWTRINGSRDKHTSSLMFSCDALLTRWGCWDDSFGVHLFPKCWLYPSIPLGALAAYKYISLVSEQAISFLADEA